MLLREPLLLPVVPPLARLSKSYCWPACCCCCCGAGEAYLLGPLPLLGSAALLVLPRKGELFTARRVRSDACCLCCCRASAEYSDAAEAFEEVRRA